MVTTDALKVRLADSGHRITEPRRALIDSMLDLGDHFTAEELMQATPGVGRATVFRTLRLFLDIGALCHVVMESGTVDYRATSDFASCEIEDLLDELHRRTGYEIQAHRLEVYGRCADCHQASSVASE